METNSQQQCNETGHLCKLKLKRLGKFWFLDIGGKLKRLSYLSNAQDVYMEENVIFADDSVYQVDIRSDETVTVAKVEDVYESKHVGARSDETPTVSKIDELHDCKQVDGRNDKTPTVTKIDESHDCKQVSERNDDTVPLTKTDELFDCYNDNGGFIRAVKEADKLSEEQTGICKHKASGCLELGHEVSGNGVDSTEDDTGSAHSSDFGSHHTDIDEDLEMGQEFISEEDDSDADTLLEMGQEEYVPRRGELEFVAMRALFDFDAVSEKELSFKQGDKLDVDKDLLSQASFWWYAFHRKSRGKGYIPRSFVLKDEKSLEAHDWWFNGNKTDAETLLQHSSRRSGTFLVRKSADGVSHVLSVKDKHKEADSSYVRHYKIMHSKERGYYISENRCFDSIPDLIMHNSCETYDICCKLEKSCPKVPPELPKRLYEWLKWLEVTKDSVKIGKRVPVTSFGENVYHGRFHNDCITVKVLRDERKPVDALLGEACLLKDLRHKSIVLLLGLCTESMPFWVITEELTNGDLLAYLRADMGKSLKLDTLIHIASQISGAMDYLTEQKVVHRNLKACNVLFGMGHKIKVSGLEQAKRINDDTFIYAFDGQRAVKWASPEAVKYGKLSEKSDVWSFGVLLYEIISFGLTPYSGLSNTVALRRTCEGYRIPKPANGSIVCPGPYYEMMLHCWDINEQRRPRFSFLQHFFEHYYVYTEERESEL